MEKSVIVAAVIFFCVSKNLVISLISCFVVFIAKKKRTACFSRDRPFSSQMGIHGKVCRRPHEKDNTQEQESRLGLSEGRALMVRGLRIG